MQHSLISTTDRRGDSVLLTEDCIKLRLDQAEYKSFELSLPLPDGTLK